MIRETRMNTFIVSKSAQRSDTDRAIAMNAMKPHLQYRTLDMSATCTCTLLQQSISKPIFYGDLVDKLKL